MAIPPNIFKSTMSRFASGVTVVTIRYGEEIHGMTASSFCSVSLTPPLVLVCVAKLGRCHAFIKKGGVFAVNLLSLAQQEWGQRFAGMQPEIGNHFAGIAYTIAQTGSPILPGTLGWVDCALRHSYEGGDHTIFVGEVVAGDTGAEAEPLLYYNRAWRALACPAEAVPA